MTILGPHEELGADTGRVPFQELSRLARHEAHRKSLHRPPYYLHKWWARRTGSVVRGILLDLLLGPEDDVMADFYEKHDFSSAVVLDPFMGGGTTLGEGLRLGCRVIGSDLNPVSWFLVHRSLQSIDADALGAAFTQVEEEASPLILALFRTTCSRCDSPATIQNVSWVTQLPCRACGRIVDLTTTQVVMRSFSTKMNHLVECPTCGQVFGTRHLDTLATCSECAGQFAPAEAKCAAADYRCSCGHEETIIQRGSYLTSPLPHRMRLLTIWCPSCGRVHQPPTHEDKVRYSDAEAFAQLNWQKLSIPKQRIPEGQNTNQLRRYGFTHWHELFNPRQLVSLSHLLNAIKSIDHQDSRELLLLIASASLEFNSMLCTAKGLGTGAVRQVFTHHAFIPPKAPLEANVWGVESSSGGFSTLYHERVHRSIAWCKAPVEPRPRDDGVTEKVEISGERLCGIPAESFHDLELGLGNLLTLNQSSEHLPQIPDSSVDVVVTDPPYADMVMYSELSDFFYVWLQLLLQDAYPASFSTSLVDDSREAVQNKMRSRDGDFYTTLVGDVFSEVRRVLRPGGRLAFTFHHSGEAGWKHIAAALVHGGFVVERWWPVFAEMESGVTIRGKDSGGHLDIVFVCAKSEDVTTRSFTQTVPELSDALSKQVPLVQADFNALWRAAQVQATTRRLLCGSEPESIQAADSSDTA